MWAAGSSQQHQTGVSVELKNLNIAPRLALAFGAIVLLLCFLVAQGLHANASAIDSVGTLVGKDVAKLRLTQEVLALARANGVQVQAIFLAEDDAVRKQHRAKLAEIRQGIDVRLGELDKLIYKPEGKALLAEFAQARAAWVAAFSSALQKLDGGQAEQGRRQFLGEALPQLAALDQPASKLAELQLKLMNESSDALATGFARSRWLMLSFAALAVLLSVVLGAWIARSITRPLGEAVTAVRRVAEGDLDFAIEVDSRDETGQLLQALRQMQQNLARTVGTVRGNAESVASASAQIAQGNTDLSQRTEEQASALQQTSATMTQLDTTVRHNADNAGRASQLAQAACNVATQGGEVVAQVVRTMQGIDSSSQRIAEIIGVIDGIAFQTNILALNAAVEAARAGE